MVEVIDSGVEGLLAALAATARLGNQLKLNIIPAHPLRD